MSDFVPCLADAQGRIIIKVGPAMSWVEAVAYLERRYPDQVASGRAVPQPWDHPGLRESD